MDEKEEKKLTIHAGNGSVVISGDVSGSSVNLVNNNAVNITNVFKPVYRAVDEHPTLPPAMKADVKAEIKDVEKEIQKGGQAEEEGMMRHLRNVQRMAPDILDVVVAALSNPVAGLGMAAKKIAQKMADEAKPKQ
ncbi:MAG: hypothetical protein HYX49_08395 [Chloroflexi bacterium]|nr:hypothetical protein [Chloroflexota bacterium]